RSLSPVEMAGIPSATESRAACVPFPDPGGPSKMTTLPRLCIDSPKLSLHLLADISKSGGPNWTTCPFRRDLLSSHRPAGRHRIGENAKSQADYGRVRLAEQLTMLPAELLQQLRTLIHERRIAAGTALLEQHKDAFAEITPADPFAGLALGCVAQWVDVGF